MTKVEQKKKEARWLKKFEENTGPAPAWTGLGMFVPILEGFGSGWWWEVVVGFPSKARGKYSFSYFFPFKAQLILSRAIFAQTAAQFSLGIRGIEGI